MLTSGQQERKSKQRKIRNSEYYDMLSQSFMMSRPTDAREVCNETFLKMEEWKEVFWGCGISERELVVVPSDTSPLAPLNQKLFIIRKE